MAVTLTSYLGLQKPAAGDNTWDVELNANFDAVSTMFATTLFISANFPTPQTLTTSQVRCRRIEIADTLSEDIIITVPHRGTWWVKNGSSGAYTITLKDASNGSDTGYVIPQGDTQLVVFNGFDNAFAVNALTTAEWAQLQNINTVSISNTAWGYLGNAGATGGSLLAAANAEAARTVLALATTSSPSFAGLTLTGDVAHADAGNDFRFQASTSDAADTSRLGLGGGGGLATSRGSHVLFHGNEHASNAGQIILRGGDVAGANIAITVYNTGNFNLDASGTGDINLKTASTSRLYVTNAGNVGINTAAPAYKLSVTGALGIAPGAGTTVTPSANGDAVFETTSNTSFTIKYKGTDGTVRSAAITLA